MGRSVVSLLDALFGIQKPRHKNLSFISPCESTLQSGVTKGGHADNVVLYTHTRFKIINYIKKRAEKVLVYEKGNSNLA